MLLLSRVCKVIIYVQQTVQGVKKQAELNLHVPVVARVDKGLVIV